MPPAVQNFKRDKAFLYKIASKYASRHQEQDDLISEGLLGLLEARRKGLPEGIVADRRMIDFIRKETTYGRTRVRRAMVSWGDKEGVALARRRPLFDKQCRARADVAILMRILPPLWAWVIKAVYLLDLSAVEVAERLGVTPGRVSQIKTESLLMMREYAQRTIL